MDFQLSVAALQKTAGRGDLTGLAAALEECLEALSILPSKQGRSPAAPIAAGVSRGGQGAATVRYHCINAEYLGILSILERTPPDRSNPLSRRPRSQHITLYSECYIKYMALAVNGVTIHGLGPLIVTIRGDMESLLRKIAPHS